MPSYKARLDRFISVKTGIRRSDVRLLLAQGRVTVDGVRASDIQQPIDQFSRVVLDEQTLQDQRPLHVMLNKPMGVVSATKDAKHKTVIDLLEPEFTADLHIVGRLDFNSTGLVLLTNDGDWSRRLMAPDAKVTKVYEVTLENVISDDCLQAFAEGMYFAYEDLVTRPAILERLTDRTARVSLVEGRYHQIKRMFGHFQNCVLTLHRVSVGDIHLDADLLQGQSRPLRQDEIMSISQ